MMIGEENIKKLKNMIASKRFVNCYSGNFSKKNQQELEQFLLKLREVHQSIIYVGIDAQVFDNFNEEEQEGAVFLELINRELTEKGLTNVDIKAISIANAFVKWSNELQERALIVFHFFSNPQNEREKNILRSLRKATRNKDQIKSYLSMLIVSDKKIHNWELYPESNLDERQVVYFKY